MTEYSVLSLGAGVQSTTLYLMAMQGALHIDAAVFADTGEEPESVYRHLDWLIAQKGPRIIVAGRGTRLGDDLIAGRNSTGQRFVSIPAFLSSHGVGRRQCSKEYKIEIIERAIRRDFLGLAPGRRVPRGIVLHQQIGISLDEAGRAARLRRRKTKKYLTRNFPLIDLGMTRADCLTWLATKGGVPHPVPRSACVFCPYRNDSEFAVIRANERDWKRAVEVDAAIRVMPKMREQQYVHRSLVPLSEVNLPAPSIRELQQGTGFSAECEGACGL